MTREGGRGTGETRGEAVQGRAGQGRAACAHSSLSCLQLASFLSEKSPHVERSGVKKRVLDISSLEDFTENVALRM